MAPIGTGGGPVVAETLEAQEVKNRQLEATEKTQQLQEEFDTEYRSDIETLFPSNEAPGVASAIAGNYDGDIAKSVESAISKLTLTKEQKTELTQNTLSYLDTELSSDSIIDTLRSEEGLVVVEGMELGYIGALTEYDNTLDLTALADTIKPGDTIKIQEGSVTINGEQAGKVESGFEDENTREVKDFSENPYFPVLSAHVENDSMTSTQLSEIQENFVTTKNISSSINQVLGTEHIVLSVIEEFDTPENVVTRKKNMLSDFPECEDSKSELITRLLSENYVRILDSEGKPDVKGSLLMAFQVAANKIVDGKRTFKRTQGFNDAYARIKAGKGDSMTMAHDLQLIHSTVNKSEGVKGMKLQARDKRGRLTAKQKTLFLETQFEEIQATLKTAGDNDIEAAKVRADLAQKALAEEARENEVGGEILSGDKKMEVGGTEVKETITPD